MAWSPIFLSLLLFLLCVVSTSTSSSSDPYIAYGPEELQSEERILHLFDAWMVRQGKTYGSPSEKATRLKVFKENLIYIDRHNRGGEYSYWLGLNRFADLTNQEFRLLYLGFNLNSSGSPKKKSGGGSFMYAGVEDVPPSLDWRLKGAVTNIKDQGTCGSSWAFSSIAAVEGINQIKTKHLLSLSEQELIDCDKRHNKKGCKGGRMDDAFGFIISNGGIDTDQDYPYKARDNQCDKARATLKDPNSMILPQRNAHAVTITTYENVPKNDEKSLLKAVANQPVSVAIEASHRDFQLYAGGVFNGKCNRNLDHGVTIVGYNTDKSWKTYWIIKNSWGELWGEQGYIRMARGMGGSEGLCGINLMPSYPVMKGLNLLNPVPTPPTPPLAQSMCGYGFSCPNSTTCCCKFLSRDICHAWGCCPKEPKNDCKDNCPHDHPTCDIAANVCGKVLQPQLNFTFVSSIFIKAFLKACFKAITKGLLSRW